MKPKELVKKWVACFNSKDIKGLSNLYSNEAVNHQVANVPVEGKEAIKKMFEQEFARTEIGLMCCSVTL